ETWRLIFDEKSLAGFYGGGEGDFEVKDGVILAHIGVDQDVAQAPRTGTTSAGATRERSFAFRRLFVDDQPAGDWSLQAQIRLDGGRMAGLCFGRKGDGAFHGLVLLPEGFLDLSRIGNDGQPLLRQKVDLTPGWHRLTLDVAGTHLAASLDGQAVLDYLF